jgi:homoserine kinase type II
MMEGKSIDTMKDAAICAATAFGLDAVAVRSDLNICGSPQRSEFRCVLECSDQRLVMMEHILEQVCTKKQAIIDRLDFLAVQGLPNVNPYLRASDGRHLVQMEGRLWQASLYVPGIPLDRFRYVFDGWRGKVMADFLIELRKKSQNLPDDLCTNPFSILDFIKTLLSQIKIREPGLFMKLVPITAFLRERLSHVHDLLPVALCHGDYHPLNMIWSDVAIECVIDWEFSGTKPENYDAATLIGCMGMENPDALKGPLVIEFISSLKDAKILSKMSWLVLVEMIIAIRFGWLSEWLRNQDTEMIELETVYMNLLMENADTLIDLWDY